MEVQIDAFWKHFELYGQSQSNEAQLVRNADLMWKAITVADAPSAANSVTGPKTIEIGRSLLSDTEKWKLQAAHRREETKVAGKEYNKKVTRATKMTLGPQPTGGFPPGRGRPIR